MKTLLEVRSLLARFLFTEEDVFKPVEVLSGRECVRLALCLLMLEEPEFLVLDEPTNHLDIDTKNVVEDVFEEWEGPMLFISHDRYFINKVANKIMHFEAGGITVFEGDYDQYKTDREKRQALEKPEKSITKRPEKAASNAQKTERHDRSSPSRNREAAIVVVRCGRLLRFQQVQRSRSKHRRQRGSNRGSLREQCVEQRDDLTNLFGAKSRCVCYNEDSMRRKGENE
ncbi:MAG: hypothetical protein MZU97_00705 [Bacillus subtilis]|nr:hypothetical protein [Bacillus subtilis]